jgi:hypothetical protein
MEQERPPKARRQRTWLEFVHGSIGIRLCGLGQVVLLVVALAVLFLGFCCSVALCAGGTETGLRSRAHWALLRLHNA